MPLDHVAERYAQQLFLARMEALSKLYATRTSETVAELAARGLSERTAGHYHSEVARVGIKHIEELTEARVDSLLAAYEQAGVAIDDQAVRDINRAVVEISDAQEGFLITGARERALRAGMPQGVAEALASSIASAMSGVKARINRRLLILRDEQILKQRAAARSEKPPPQPETTGNESDLRRPESKTHVFALSRRLWDQSAHWQWYAGFFCGAFLMISIQEYFFALLLLLLSAVSLLSKLVHIALEPGLRFAGVLAVVLSFSLFLYIVLAVKGNAPWSHVQAPLAELFGSYEMIGPPKPIPPIPPRQETPHVAHSEPNHVFSGPNGFLQLAKIQYVTGHEFFTVGLPLQVNVYYQNKGRAPIENGYVSASLFFVTRHASVSQPEMDATVLRKFQIALREEKDRGSPVGIDTLLWATPSFPFVLTQPMVDAINSGELVFYVVSHARWTDSYDRRKETLNCVWLLPPNDLRPPLDSLRWHECSR
jgi:hypothetical protein